MVDIASSNSWICFGYMLLYPMIQRFFGAVVHIWMHVVEPIAALHIDVKFIFEILYDLAKVIYYATQRKEEEYSFLREGGLEADRGSRGMDGCDASLE
jgi:hypothetical protein